MTWEALLRGGIAGSESIDALLEWGHGCNRVIGLPLHRLFFQCVLHIKLVFPPIYIQY